MPVELGARIAALESKEGRQQNIISDLKAKLSESQAESETLKRDLFKTTDQFAQKQEEAHALDAVKAELNRARSDEDSVDAALVDQQIKINEFAAQVKEKEAIAEREREVSGVAKDVRELMGARNLHILDVSDVDGNGRSKKSFGRVFLVQDKLLIFYAFDLGDHGNPAKVSFQAGGKESWCFLC